ncbi:MAG TPA: acetamidase/formamidase family protein [Burkholderiales bacterium]|nr:acetamidase/formamidase family protein [Burkholderiales bacterium]
MVLARIALVCLTLAALGGCVSTSPVPYTVDAHLASTPSTVVWGYIPPGRNPVLTIKSGQTVKIDTLSHQGMAQGVDPVTFFGAGGIQPAQVLKDAMDVYYKVGPLRTKGGSAHVLTGPIHVEGAEPGDMLEVRVMHIDFRTPYGVNNSNKGSGVLPGLHAKPYPKIIKFDLDRKVALFAPGIEIPLSPFMGIMAVTPPAGTLPSTRPPGIYGGNMDFHKLTTGASLYLPVFQPGAMFYTGDSHAVQGDGEVNGTAIEASLSPVLQFIVHKGAGKGMKWPRAEDSQNYYVMGMDVDLNVALREAVQESAKFLREQRNLSDGDAYSLASVATHFSVAEAVNHVGMIYGAIPKRVFQSNQPFWSDRR